jgi:ABC-type Fe3+-siderophore transport system permease subunit
VTLSPAAWFLNLEADFALAPQACVGPGKTALYLITLAAFVLAALAGAFSLFQFRVASHATNPVDEDFKRRYGLAVAGMGLSALCIALLIAQSIPTLMFTGCE